MNMMEPPEWQKILAESPLTKAWAELEKTIRLNRQFIDPTQGILSDLNKTVSNDELTAAILSEQTELHSTIKHNFGLASFQSEVAKIWKQDREMFSSFASSSLALHNELQKYQEQFSSEPKIVEAWKRDQLGLLSLIKRSNPLADFQNDPFSNGLFVAERALSNFLEISTLDRQINENLGYFNDFLMSDYYAKFMQLDSFFEGVGSGKIDITDPANEIQLVLYYFRPVIEFLRTLPLPVKIVIQLFITTFVPFILQQCTNDEFKQGIASLQEEHAVISEKVDMNSRRIDELFMKRLSTATCEIIGAENPITFTTKERWAKLMERPSNDSKVIAEIPPSQNITILKRQNEWVKITYNDAEKNISRTGWVLDEHCSVDY